MNTQVKVVAAGICTLLVLLVVGILLGGLVGYNNTHDWQLYQSVTGDITVIDSAGYYWKGFGTVWTYPRSIQAYYSASHREGDSSDDSIRVTFNDGGTAAISSFVKVALPTDKEHRLLLHQDFNANPKNISDAVRSHLVNCIKSTGPMMSASENQASRKAEFNQVVEEQLIRGLYEMRRTEVELKDVSETVAGGVGADGKPIAVEKRAKVMATEVVLDDKGKPIVVQPSPLDRYKIGIIQFSVTETEYDQQTLAQFSAKKESYLKAEQAKAQRQEEYQQRLMVTERGLRQVAEITAEENQKKTRATIQAQQRAEVAIIAKQEAVTQALQKVEVASQEKSEATTRKAIALLYAETAEINKKATISAAEAKQKSIELAGDITEKDRVLATIKADRDAKVAVALAGVKTPGIVIVGSDANGKTGGGLNENLMNLMLLRATGVLPTEPVVTPTVK